jgi:DNA mismatch repair protein PMS2
MEVKRIANEHVLKISSGQVIVSLASATKELIENALDAGASSVEVIMTNHGVDSIEVCDNGKGIPSEHYVDVVGRYTTSKLTEVEDLGRITSYGFRGEGLNSLSSVSKLSIVTRTSNDTTATSLTYDEQGRLLTQNRVAGGVGTSVKISELFHSLPVRRNELIKNFKREYSKLLALVQAYAIICSKVSFTVSHTDKKGERTKVLHTNGKGDLCHSLTEIFGKRFLTTLMKFDAKLHDTREVSVSGYVSINDSKSCRATSSHQFAFLNGRPVDLPKLSRAINEVYRSVNPVVLRQQSFPVFILDITIPPNMVDINLAPDKRTVLFVDQDSILNMLKSWLCRRLDPDGERTFELQILPPVRNDPGPVLHVVAPLAPEDNTPKKVTKFPDRVGSPGSDSMEIDVATQNTEMTPLRPTTSPVLIPSPPQYSQRDEEPKQKPLQVNPHSSQQSNFDFFEIDSFQPPLKKPFTQYIAESSSIDIDSAFAPSQPKKNSIEAILEVYQQKPPEKPSPAPRGSRASLLDKLHLFRADSSSNIDDIQQAIALTVARPPKEVEEEDSPEPSSNGFLLPHHIPKPGIAHHVGCHHDGPHDHIHQESDSMDIAIEFDLPHYSPSAVSHIAPAGKSKLKFNMNAFTEQYKARETRIGKAAEQQQMIHSKLKRVNPDRYKEGPVTIDSKHFRRFSSISSVSANTERTARDEMTKQVAKSDFSRMVIIGQFNKAFIIAKLDEELFILDQHACDEKYNFEELCKAKKISIQTLMAPLPLELSPPDAAIVLENMQEFTQRGFKIELAPATDSAIHRLQLTGFALKKSSGDVHAQIQEIVEILKLGGDLGIVPSEYKANASEACRKSIMFGAPLEERKMQEVVDHMATMNRPWNCPHGRPTMRHLMSLYHYK